METRLIFILAHLVGVAGELAHMVERSLSMREVPGSIPGFSIPLFFFYSSFLTFSTGSFLTFLATSFFFNYKLTGLCGGGRCSFL